MVTFEGIELVPVNFAQLENVFVIFVRFVGNVGIAVKPEPSNVLVILVTVLGMLGAVASFVHPANVPSKLVIPLGNALTDVNDEHPLNV